MQDMHSHMMETKAIEFIFALFFLTGFILFWRFLNLKRK
jgi:hypothetical protein